ncbi:MAG: hypothetical protein DRG24_02340 [Epsilonproteobacteria bacterium]|nr:MAG: hypothetical protein DRG24_02340 [Campylobacterota bacterium]
MRKILLMMIVSVYVSAASLDEKIAYLDNVKELVVLTGQMRDDTHVFNRGGYISSEAIEKDRNQVTTSLRNLRHKFNTVDIQIDDEFSQLNLYMQSLNDIVPDLDAMTTFRAYTLLTREMIKLGQKLQQKFFFNESTLNQRVSSIMIENILPVMEHMAVLRGLGSGVAICSDCTDGESEELKNYVVKVVDNLDGLMLEIEALRWEYATLYPDVLNAKLRTYQKKVKQYIQLVELKLLDTDEVKLDQYDFYADGSSLIDQTLELYKINETILKKHSKAKTAHLTFK